MLVKNKSYGNFFLFFTTTITTAIKMIIKAISGKTIVMTKILAIFHETKI